MMTVSKLRLIERKRLPCEPADCLARRDFCGDFLPKSVPAEERV